MSDPTEDRVVRSRPEEVERLRARPPEQSRAPERPTIPSTQLPAAAPDSPLRTEWDFYRRIVGRLLAEGHEGKWLPHERRLSFGRSVRPGAGPVPAAGLAKTGLI